MSTLPYHVPLNATDRHYAVPPEPAVDLYVGDTQRSKFQLIAELAEQAAELLPPIYIISHRREADLPTLATFPALRQLGTLVVAEEELEDYLLWHPYTRVQAIPAGYAGLDGGVGRARQYVLDQACEYEQEHVMILDDDIVGASILYGTGPDKCSTAYTAVVDDRTAFHLGLLVLACQAAEEVFREVPSTALCAPQNRNGARTADNAARLWDTNTGRIPMQAVSWHVPRIMEKVGGFDLARFNRHGEDLFLALSVLQAGGSVARVPSVLFSYWPEHDGRSVVRTFENTMELREVEREGIRTLPIYRDGYVREAHGKDGEFKGCAPDWRKLHADNVAPVESSGWI